MWTLSRATQGTSKPSAFFRAARSAFSEALGSRYFSVTLLVTRLIISVPWSSSSGVGPSR